MAVAKLASKWFIDAWAVRDGRAFVSQRPPESIDSSATVFLSVPDLEPVPIGRISTALRATRSGFQEGFRNADGGEIAFDSLDQVRELIKRVYLAGGLGDAAPGAPVREPPPRDESTGGAYFESAIERESLDVEWFKDGGPPPAQQLAKLRSNGTEQLETLVREFARATILEWNHVLEQAGPDDYRSFAAWCGHLGRSGLVDTWWDLDELEIQGIGAIQEFLGSDPGGSRLILDWPPMIENVSSLSNEDLLVRAPLPRGRGWDPRLSRIAEKRILPLVHEDYFAANPSLPELAPAVLIAHLACGPHPFGRMTGEAPLLQPALQWLQRELPRVRLPEAAVDAIRKFVDAQFERRPPSN